MERHRSVGHSQGRSHLSGSIWHSRWRKTQFGVEARRWFPAGSLPSRGSAAEKPSPRARREESRGADTSVGDYICGSQAIAGGKWRGTNWNTPVHHGATKASGAATEEPPPHGAVGYQDQHRHFQLGEHTG